MLIDTHAHLYWDSYKEDFGEVIQRAVDAGVSAIINVGVDVEKSQEALRLATSNVASLNRYSSSAVEKLQLYSAIGIHPHEAIRYTELGQKPHDRNTFVHKDKDRDRDRAQDIAQLEEIYRGNPEKVVAVGECGLDYLQNNNYNNNYNYHNFYKNSQRKLFQAQIDLAKRLNLPLIVHCRDDRSENPENDECWEAVIEMTQDHFGIYHCYSGLPPTTNYLLQSTNFLVSFAANITYPKNEYLREAVKLIPLNRIVLETDSPFLSPQSKRGQRNEPSSVKEIARLIADLKGISPEEIAKQTTANAQKICFLKLN